MATSTLPAQAPSAPTAAPTSWDERIHRALFAPVEIGMLVFFRVAFGVIMLVESWRYLNAPNGVSWVERNYINPDFHFTFFGFSWVHTWPGNGMTYAFYAMGVLAACIAAGFLYRVATVLFFLNFAHIFLCDQAYYLNHFYLLTLISLMMCFLPANRAWSVDVLIWPKLYSPTVPVWTLRLLQLHIGMAYFYGGIAKLNGDWFLGEPMRGALAARPGFPLIGQWFHEEWMVSAFVWGGVLFDLLIVPALIWPRTRMAAFIASLGFNLTNSILFQIGIFPWFMVAGTMLFFPPDWIQVGPSTTLPPEKGPHRLTRGQKVIATLLAVYVTGHVLMPFRHFFYPGNVSWTEEGHLYSWHMKLRRKSGQTRFTAVTSEGRRLPEETLFAHADKDQLDRFARRKRYWTERVTKEENLYVTPRQRSKMSGRPEMIVEYAHFLADEFRRAGYGDVAIYCDSAASLNGRPYQPIVDPAVDLAKVEISMRPASWIVPLAHPLPARGETPDENPADDVE